MTDSYELLKNGCIDMCKGKQGKGEWSRAKASGVRASGARASEVRASKARWRGEEQEKGDQPSFPLSSLSSKLLRFFFKSDIPLYWYFQRDYNRAFICYCYENNLYSI